MKTSILLIFSFILSLTTEKDNLKYVDFHYSSDEIRFVTLNKLPHNNNCNSKYYSLSIHDTIKSKSAWLNPIKTYSFQLNDSNYNEFKNEFEIVIMADKRIGIECLEERNNWYRIKNKQGKTYWTSAINYNYWCATSFGQIDNITLEK
jgi:hypothetical protein